MTKRIEKEQGREWYEYHGSTAVVHFWAEEGTCGLQRRWLYFDTVQEAFDYFNEAAW